MRQEREAGIHFILTKPTSASYPIAASKIGLGRKQLGVMKNLYSLGGIPMPQNTARYPDGTVIRVTSIPTATGIVQDYITIDVSSVTTTVSPGTTECLGLLSGLADILSPVFPIQITVVDGEDVDSVDRFYIQRLDQDDGSESIGPWENYLATSEADDEDNIDFLDPFRAGTMPGLKPGRFSGRMRKLVQTMLGMGLDIGNFQYSHSNTDGIWRGSDGTEWLVQINPNGFGVIAAQFQQCQKAISVKNSGEDLSPQQEKIWDNLGFIPIDQTYPFSDVDIISAGIADGTILQLMDATEMQTFISASKNSFFSDCGWAWTNDCRECQNVVWDRPGAKKFSYRYKIVIGGGTQPTSVTISEEESGQIWARETSNHIKFPNYLLNTLLSENLQYGETTGDATISTGPLHVFYNQNSNTPIVCRLTAEVDNGTIDHNTDFPFTGAGLGGVPNQFSNYNRLLKDGTESSKQQVALAVDPGGSDVGTDLISGSVNEWALFQDPVAMQGKWWWTSEGVAEGATIDLRLCTGKRSSGGSNSWSTSYEYRVIVPFNDREAMYRYVGFNDIATSSDHSDHQAPCRRGDVFSASNGQSNACGPGDDGKWYSDTVLTTLNVYEAFSGANLYSPTNPTFTNPSCTVENAPDNFANFNQGEITVTVGSSSTVTFFDGSGSQEIIRSKDSIADDTQYTRFVTFAAPQTFSVVVDAWSGHRMGSLEANNFDATDPTSVFTLSGIPSGFPVNEIDNIQNTYWFGIPT